MLSLFYRMEGRGWLEGGNDPRTPSITRAWAASHSDLSPSGSLPLTSLSASLNDLPYRVEPYEQPQDLGGALGGVGGGDHLEPHPAFQTQPRQGLIHPQLLHIIRCMSANLEPAISQRGLVEGAPQLVECLLSMHNPAPHKAGWWYTLPSQHSRSGGRKITNSRPSLAIYLHIKFTARDS